MLLTKKIFLLLLLLPCIGFALDPYIEFKYGGFAVSKSLTRVYIKNPVYQGELGVLFNDYFGAALNFQYMSKKYDTFFQQMEHKGHTYALRSHTITLPSIALIFKGYFPIHEQVRPYVGIGPKLLFTRLCFDRILREKLYIREKYLGTLISAGILIYSEDKHFFIDPFVDYSCRKLFSSRAKGRYYQIIYGVGLGYVF